jgi:hypothetical protein
MKNKLVSPALALAFAFLLQPISSLLAQGPLTPQPGAPAPTMKTLQQVEPRTDLNTLGGDATTVCTIVRPGSYYLSADLAGAAGKSTIRVATAGRVTIDLNGFALTSTGAGQMAILPNNDLVVRNGYILADANSSTKAIGGRLARVVCEDLGIFGNGGTVLDLGADAAIARCRLTDGGIACQERSVVRETVISAKASDVSVTLGDESQAVGLVLQIGLGALAVGERGLIADCAINAAGPPPIIVNGAVLIAGEGSVVRHCSVAAGNTAGSAIVVGTGALVSGCRVSSAFRDGIAAASLANVTVESCSVQGNGRDGIVLGANARVRDCSVQGSGAQGIEVGENSLVSGCVVSGCGGGGIRSTFENVSVTRCTLKGNSGGPGISLVIGTVSECDVTGNTGGAGIQVTAHSLVLRNRSERNGVLSTDPQAGLRVIGARNRLEGNHLVSNTGFGLEITSSGSINANTGNLTIGNHARSNDAGQFSISSGNATGPILTTSQVATTTSPTANFGP